MNSKKSGNNNPKKNVRKVNKKTSMSKRHRDIGNQKQDSRGLAKQNLRKGSNNKK
jgi:hypothetical protein